MRAKKEDDIALRDQFSRQIREEFPDASKETLNAMVTRLIYEQELKSRLPDDPELTLKPDIAKTLRKVSERECHHNGKYEARKFGQKEGQPVKMAWSCCQNKDRDSEGCIVRIVDK